MMLLFFLSIFKSIIDTIKSTLTQLYKYNNIIYGKEDVNFKEFESCIFYNCNFSKCIFLAVTFSDCTFSDAKINYVTLQIN